jgi:hypothetical protein
MRAGAEQPAPVAHPPPRFLSSESRAGQRIHTDPEFMRRGDAPPCSIGGRHDPPRFRFQTPVAGHRSPCRVAWPPTYFGQSPIVLTPGRRRGQPPELPRKQSQPRRFFSHHTGTASHPGPMRRVCTVAGAEDPPAGTNDGGAPSQHRAAIEVVAAQHSRGQRVPT